MPDVVGRMFGPAVLALLFTWVTVTRGSEMRGQKVLMLIALGFSFIADIILGFNFLYGLAVFLLMHIIYIVIGSRRGGWSWRMLPFAALYLVAVALVVSEVWPTVSADPLLRIAVPVYIAVITLMATLAASAWYRDENPLYANAALGALIFVASDACIAIDEFAHPRELSGLWVLPTYWIAQYLIASSLPSKLTQTTSKKKPAIS